MKILWHSNSPYTPTGYGNQTKIFTSLLTEQGHEVAVSCFWGLHSARLVWQGIPLYPAGLDQWGNDVLAAHAADWFGGSARDGLVITLMDVWVTQPWATQRVNWAPWVPVDSDPLPPPCARALQQGGAVPIAMSRFGERKLRDAGFDPLYVPHGIDTETMCPVPREEARAAMGMSPDAFLVGMVAANKGNPSRKSFPECIAAFAHFRKSHPDSILYLHTEQAGLHQGVNLPELLQQFCLPKEAVWYCDQYRYLTGALTERHLVTAYSAMDVLLNPSTGEGFGIPIVEAQACGTPVIVTDFTAMPELCGSGWKVDGQRFWTALAAWQMVPNVDSIVSALELAYKHRGDMDMRKAARHFAEQYDCRRVAERYWKPALAAIEQRIRPAEMQLVKF